MNISAQVMPVFEKMISGMSVTPICPRCKRAIPSEDVNVAQDIAFCRNCDLSHRLSTLTSATPVDENVDVNRPPAGAWHVQDGEGVRVGSTLRSLGQAFALLFFCLFWNGIVSVFVFMAAASTLHHLGMPLPSWVHLKGGFAPIGLTLFMWIFLTPFVCIGLAMLATFVSCLAGRIEVRTSHGEAVLFTGVGPIGFRRRFSVSDVMDVRLEENNWRDSRGASRRGTQIVVDTKQKPYNFGSMLSAERRRFLAAVLKKEMVRR
jgi:hypothetical protein